MSGGGGEMHLLICPQKILVKYYSSIHLNGKQQCAIFHVGCYLCFIILQEHSDLKLNVSTSQPRGRSFHRQKFVQRTQLQMFSMPPLASSISGGNKQAAVESKVEKWLFPCRRRENIGKLA
jgi:hypothetical protein